MAELLDTEATVKAFEEKTNKLTVLYAKLAPNDMTLEFAIKIIKPIQLYRHTHEYIRIFDVDLIHHEERIPLYLKNVVLKKYYELLNANVSEQDIETLKREGRGWILKIDDAELIECEFMVPKNKIKE